MRDAARDLGGTDGPLLISVVGLQNTGKTFVATRMTEVWTRLGFHVAALKHDGHMDRPAVAEPGASGEVADAERIGLESESQHLDDASAPPSRDDWEKEGSDTRRYASAGAAFTMVAGGGQTLLRSTADVDAHHPLRLCERLTHFAAEQGKGLDIIVIEGYKSEDFPKIVVLRDNDVAWYRQQHFADVRAIVRSPVAPSAHLDALSTPVYDESNLADLCRRLVRP